MAGDRTGAAADPYAVSGVALVTGAGSGIGRATAQALATAGADVCVVDIDARGGSETVDAVVRAGRRGQLVHADLSDVGGLPDVVEQAVAGLGAIDVLVNNAAAPSRVPLVEVGETTWREVLELDLTSPWRLSQIVARQMIERGVGGSIVNLSSSSAFRARRAHGAYGVAKAAVVALTRIMAGELGAHGINVNAVAPGVTATAMGGLLGDVDALQSAVSEGPLENLFHRVSTSDDVANAIVFLCSSASRQITGQVVHTSAGAVISA